MCPSQMSPERSRTTCSERSRERVRLDLVLLGSRHAPEHDRLRRHRERVPRRAPAMSKEVVMHRLAFVISTAALVAGLAAGNN